jgi:hypothetical protein
LKPKQTIQIDVQPYDETQERLLRDYSESVSRALDRMIESTTAIPVSDFLAYYLLHRKGRTGYRTLQEVQQKAMAAKASLDDIVDYESGSIFIAKGDKGLPRDLTEHIGEAVGLSVISGMYGLTGADWEPIDVPVVGGVLTKAMDFEIAATATQIIQVETKGSAVENNQSKGSAVSNHKASIAAKKRTIRAMGSNYPLRPAVKFGTITVVDSNHERPAKCLLVDPDPTQLSEEPEVYRLLARTTFLSRWLSVVSPRSQLAAALGTRLRALLAMRKPDELAGIPLVRGNGESFDNQLHLNSGTHSEFFAHRTRVAARPIGGIAFKTSDSQLTFIGLREDLVRVGAAQDFDTLKNYSAEPESWSAAVTCVFHINRLRGMEFPKLEALGQASKGYRTFDLQASLHQSSSGLVLGFMDIPR